MNQRDSSFSVELGNICLTGMEVDIEYALFDTPVVFDEVDIDVDGAVDCC